MTYIKSLPFRLISSSIPNAKVLDFDLPPELEAGEPPEARGLARDEVRLMVSYLDNDRIAHARFRDLPDFLRAGDVLAINTSGTMNAALPATRADGTPLELHLSTHLPAAVAILEDHQPPYEEYYRVPPETAHRVNLTRAAGHRVIAVGTTAVRALETVTDTDGVTHSGEGWTRAVVTPGRGIHAVNA